MTNEKKAREIISQWKEKNKFVCNFNDIQALGVALEIAEWKDKEFRHILDIAFDAIGEQNGHCSEDVFEYLQKIRELLRREQND